MTKTNLILLWVISILSLEPIAEYVISRPFNSILQALIVVSWMILTAFTVYETAKFINRKS
jgi:hypothetical protein